MRTNFWEGAASTEIGTNRCNIFMTASWGFCDNYYDSRTALLGPCGTLLRGGNHEEYLFPYSGYA
eukprot:7194660-Pyramimonas_sp.AAC.1